MNNNFDHYLQEQLKDPEFQVNYLFAKEKVKLDIFIEQIKEDLKNDVDKKKIITNLNKMKKHISTLSIS